MHSTRELDLIHWAVEMVLKGGVPKERVLNCAAAAQIEKHFTLRRSAAKGPGQRVEPQLEGTFVTTAASGRKAPLLDEADGT